MEERKYIKWTPLGPVEIPKGQLIQEAWDKPKGLKLGAIYAPASVCKKKLIGWGWNLKPYGITSNIERTEDYNELSKSYWIIPVPDDVYKLIPTTKVISFDKALEAYWRQFPKSDYIWAVLDMGQPFIRDFALAVGNLAYDDEWRKKARVFNYNPFFAAMGKDKEAEDLIRYTRKKLYNWVLSGEYGRQVHNPDLLWQITTNTLTSPSVFGYHGFRGMSMAAGKFLKKNPVARTMGEFLKNRTPDTLLDLFKTTEDLKLNKISKSILDTIEPMLGKGMAGRLVRDGLGKESAEVIVSERKAIGRVFNVARETLEKPWLALSEGMRNNLVKYWKTGKAALDDSAKEFDSLVKTGMKKLSGRFILKPEEIKKITTIFSETPNSIGFMNRLKKEVPYLTKAMRAKFRTVRKIKGEIKRVRLTEGRITKILERLDVSQIERKWVKEFRIKEYIPRKIPMERVAGEIYQGIKDPRGFYSYPRKIKDWNPANSDEAFQGVMSRVILPQLKPHYQMIRHHTRKVGLDALRIMKETSEETIKEAVLKSDKAAMLTPAKRLKAIKMATGFWIDLVIVGRLPAFFINNTVDDSFRMIVGVVDGLAEGRRPTWQMVKHWNKYKTPKEVFGKTFASAIARGDTNRFWAFNRIYEGISHAGIEAPEQFRRVGLYKYQFFSRLGQLKRQGVPITNAYRLAKEASIKDVDKFMFDYSRPLLFDQILGPAAPFVKFYRQSTKLFIDQSIKNPWLIHSMSKAWTALSAIGAEKMPSHLKGFHKIFGETYFNPGYIFSWGPAWDALAKLDDEKLKDVTSSLERKYQRFLKYSPDFQKKMISEDFELASYVRSRSLPVVTKFFDAVSKITPLAPWASLPAGAAGLMTPEFKRSIIPQSDLIHQIFGINIEPWLKETREERVKKRTTMERVGQLVKGEKPDIDLARKKAEDRGFNRSWKKLIVGGWLTKIYDWEVDFYNALNSFFEKEIMVREPTLEDLKSIMEDYDIAPEEARESHIQEQIYNGKQFQKNYRRAKLENYPFLGMYFQEKYLDRLSDMEKEVEEEKKKSVNLLKRMPPIVQDKVYQDLDFLRAITTHQFDEVGKKIIKGLTEVTPDKWKKKIESMSLSTKEYLQNTLSDVKLSIDDLLKKGEEPQDAIPGTMGKASPSMLKLMLAWIKSGVVSTADAAVIKTEFGRSVSDKELETQGIIENRARQKKDEFEKFRVLDYWGLKKPVQKEMFRKVQDWYSDFKESDVPALAMFKKLYWRYFVNCENISEGRWPYENFGEIPEFRREWSPEFEEAYNKLSHVDADDSDPYTTKFENYKKVRDVEFDGKTFEWIMKNSKDKRRRSEYGRWESKIKGIVTVPERIAQLKESDELMTHQAKRMFTQMKISGDPIGIVNHLYKKDKPFLDVMVKKIPELRPMMEEWKYNNLDFSYLRLAESYENHPAILDEIPEGAWPRLAYRDRRFASMLRRAGKDIKIPTGMEAVMKLQEEPYTPLDFEIERDELANIPNRPGPEAFNDLISLLSWGRIQENDKANSEGRSSTLRGAFNQSLRAIGMEFKTKPTAIATMWPLANETINLGIKVGAFDKEDIPRIREATELTSAVMAGTVTGYKAASFLTTAALGTPVGMIIGATLFGLASWQRQKERKKLKKAREEWDEERKKEYEVKAKERESYYASQAAVQKGIAIAQEKRTKKLAGEMYRKQLGVLMKTPSPIRRIGEQPEWFKKRFKKQFAYPLQRYSKRGTYESKLGLIRTIEKAIPRPEW